MSLIVESDTELNDSNKTIVVPTGYVYEILYCGVKLISDGTVGNRQMVLLITDEDDAQIIEFPAGSTQAASLTRYYNFTQGGAHESSFVNTTLNIPICDELVVPEGYKIVIKDSAAVAATGDDMTVKLVARRLRRF